MDEIINDSKSPKGLYIWIEPYKHDLEDTLTEKQGE